MTRPRSRNNHARLTDKSSSGQSLHRRLAAFCRPAGRDGRQRHPCQPGDRPPVEPPSAAAAVAAESEAMFSEIARPMGLAPEPVIALHCSGAGAAQWRRLGSALATQYELIAPEHYGCDSVGPWTGEHAFRLAEEAARTISFIDGTDRKVHLVGHSY